MQRVSYGVRCTGGGDVTETEVERRVVVGFGRDMVEMVGFGGLVFLKIQF